MTELYKLPRNTPLRILADGGYLDGTFHHIDGMYSYCTLAGGEPFHLKAWTPMVEVDGRWEISSEVEP